MKAVWGILVAVVCLGVPIAWADVAPPNTSDCRTKKEGDSCQTDDKLTGSCQKQTCQRLDYSDGTPPSTVNYDCLVCKAGGGSTEPVETADKSSGGTPDTAQSKGTGCIIDDNTPISAGFRFLLLGLVLFLAWRWLPKHKAKDVSNQP